MKRKPISKLGKITTLLLFALLAIKATYAVDIVGFTLATGTAGAATSGVGINYPDKGRTLTAVGLTTTGYSANGLTGAGWDNNGSDGFTTNTFSTVGYLSTAVAGQIRGTSTGPKYLKAQYSLDGSSWTDVPDNLAYSDDNPNIVVTGSFADFKFRLPFQTDNQGTAYVRWIQDGTSAIGGGSVTSAGTISMKAVVMQSELLSAPTSQSTQITIVSLTATTITVGCTPGSGNRRYLAINTVNSFSTPNDDDIYTANATYDGSGEQIVYVGSGTVTTVNVPSSLNTYWFRYFDYNQLDQLTRYCTVNASLSKNPKMCALPSIHTPTHSYGLTRATLGATIDAVSGDVGAIIDRGVFWDYTPGIDNNTQNFVQAVSVSAGSYTVIVPDGVQRGSTIYYKGYAENESGVILTSESSFDNTPIFTGTGTWETAARWNVQEVPGANGDPTYGSAVDSPIINGTCTQTVDNNVTNLTINASRILNINPDVSLTVDGTISNSGGTAGLVLKSDATGTGSLMHNTANVNATVQRYISGSSNLFAKKYHLVSVPINAETYLSGVWLDSYLFTYLEATNGWYKWDDPTNKVLQTKQGAMVFYPNWDTTTSKTYSITGQLNNGTYSPTVTYGGSGFGFNLVPNPYPSAIDWNAASGWTKTNISGTIWGFNSSTGSYGSWNGTTGTNSVGRYIPVGQAFFVQATGSPTLTMTNSVRLHNTSDFLKSGELVPNILHLIASGNGGQDEIAVQFAYDATETSLDSYDAAKFYSDMQVPQLSTYTSVDNTALSITGLPNSENSSIVPLRFEMDYSGEITFSASAVESFNNSTPIKLEDKQLSQLIDLRTTPNYTFTHTPGDANDRFVLHFGSVLGTGDEQAELAGRVTVSGNQIYVEYPSSASKQLKAVIYDSQGRAISQFKLNGSGQENVTIPSSGVYFVKLWLDGGVETHKIVVL